jgi:hypothetical protein
MEEYRINRSGEEQAASLNQDLSDFIGQYNK